MLSQTLCCAHISVDTILQGDEEHLEPGKIWSLSFPSKYLTPDLCIVHPPSEAEGRFIDVKEVKNFKTKQNKTKQRKASWLSGPSRGRFHFWNTPRALEIR